MTFIDWINSLPQWAGYSVVALLAVWSFEMFLYPLKQNIQRKRIKDLLEIQKKFLQQLQERTDDLEKSNAMCASLMALILKKEQKEEKEREARKNKTNNGRKKQSAKPTITINNGTESGS